MSAEVEPRVGLIARVALLQKLKEPEPKFDDIDATWKAGEAYVAAMEAEPDKPVQCPCCEKLVTLCVKHYQLHEPGKPCVDCRRGE